MELPFNPVWLLAAVPIIVLMLSAAKSKAATDYPYVRVEGLFTENERRFLGVLEQAAAPNRVFGKVRVADVLTVRKGLLQGRRGALNRLTQKHMDFVVCHPHDLSILYVVELDDKTHDRTDRRARDAFLNHALAAAEVPLVRVKSRSTYGVAELRAVLTSYTVPKAA